MGKKRFNATTLTKTYAQTSSRGDSASTGRSPLSVSDKLSKLRLEGLQRHRNAVGTLGGTLDLCTSAIRGDAEIDDILGRQHVTPRSRVKLRRTGHMAPKSWTEPPTISRASAVQAHEVSTGTMLSLIDICLDDVGRHIDQYLECGMQFLPGYMKARILSSLPQTDNDVVWDDIVPSVLEDDTIEFIDISCTKVSTKALRRLTSLRAAEISYEQLVNGIGPVLPSVLQELTIRLNNSAGISSDPRLKIQLRKLSLHFVAMRTITLDLCMVRSKSAQAECLSVLCEAIASPDWATAFDTLRQIKFILASTQAIFTGKESVQLINDLQLLLRRERRPGKHIDVSISPSLSD